MLVHHLPDPSCLSSKDEDLGHGLGFKHGESSQALDEHERKEKTIDKISLDRR
jgi:hypothetical protein